jgi:hypothetical protein
MARVSSWLVFAGLLLISSRLAAQSDGSEGQSESDVPTAAETAAATDPERLGDEQALQEERTPEEHFRESSSPYEDPSKRYYFLGAGWRFASLPSGLLKAYTVETEASPFTPASFFAEAAMRRKGFQIGVNLGYVNWGFQDAFRLKSDAIEDMEWLNIKFNFIVTSATITWSTSFKEWFALEYGLEAGFAFLIGRMIRNEATPNGKGKWRKCETWADQLGFTNENRSFPNPRPTGEQVRYCDAPLSEDDETQPPATNPPDEIGAHYGVKAKRGAFNEGVPYVLPVLGPRVSLRFKPIAQLVLRVDVPLPIIPFGIMGGVSAQFGF